MSRNYLATAHSYARHLYEMTRHEATGFVAPQLQSLVNGESANTLTEFLLKDGVLFQGEPGSGKTYLLRYLVAEQAQNYLNGITATIPILIQANRLSPSERKDVVSWIARQAHQQAQSGMLNSGPIRDAIREQNARIFVDGLDEIVDLSLRVSIMEALYQLIEENEGLSLIASARNFSSLPERLSRRLEPWTILPFNEARLIELRALQLGRYDDSQQVSDSRILKESQGNPLIASLLFTYATEKEFKLPKSRGKLFEDITHAIFFRERERTTNAPSVQALETGHEIIAATLAVSNLPYISARMARSLLNSDAQWALTEEEADFLLSYALQRVGILNSPTEGHIGFAHRAFYDYFVGRLLAHNVNASDGFLLPDLDQPLLIATGLAADPIPVITFAYRRKALKLAASCCKELENPQGAREHLVNLVLGELGSQFLPTLREILKLDSLDSKPLEEQQPESGSSDADFYTALQERWVSLPRKGATANDRGRSWESFARKLFGAHFKVIEARHHHRVGEIDLICEMKKIDPFWVYHGGDVWVECKNTEDKATIEQVNTFIGKLVGSRWRIGFFLSTSGFTRDAARRMREAAASSTSPLIVPVTGNDIQQLIANRTDLSEFFKDCVRKIA
ncbi:NACHT domain-containing protein [Streptomyces ziwulingensis]